VHLSHPIVQHLKSSILVGPMLIVGVLVAAVCGGQAPPKKPTPKTTVAKPTFGCPDKEAQQACKSYDELLKAKDPGLPVNNAYICFRKSADEFFVVTVNRPIFPKHWDKELKQMVPDDTPRPGHGYAETYKKGVLDSTIMPTFNFSGQWQPLYPESGFFTSDKINGKNQDEKDPDVGVLFYDTQVNIGYKYANRLEKTITYTLAIQRSTGRFAESFLTEEDKFPFSESTADCVYR